MSLTPLTNSETHAGSPRDRSTAPPLRDGLAEREHDGVPRRARPTEPSEESNGDDVANEGSVDERVGEASGALTAINCKLRGLDVVDCMIQCAQAGFPCRPRLPHPNKVDAGNGDLMGCGDFLSRKTCIYDYANGDRCYVIDRLPWIPCTYPGGWAP